MTDQPAIPAPPANATEASARLGERTADKEWSGKLLNGDVAANREFQELTELVANGDKVDAAIAGIVPGLTEGLIPNGEDLLMANTAAMLRDVGILNPAVLREALTDQEVTQQEHDLVANWKAQSMRDPEFTKRYLSGDPLANKEMWLANIVLTRNIKKAEKAQ